MERERCSHVHLDAITSDDVGNLYAFRGERPIGPANEWGAKVEVSANWPTTGSGSYHSTQVGGWSGAWGCQATGWGPAIPVLVPSIPRGSDRAWGGGEISQPRSFRRGKNC